MNKVYILLGANLGNPIRQLRDARAHIEQDIGHIVAHSSIYESAAWGVEDQPVFFNQVVLVETVLTPHDVLGCCQKTENLLGRVRKEKWGARLIDIDILYFNDEQVKTSDLVIPHPYLHLRKFTLLPLCEIAEDYIHPLLQRSNKELLASLTDTLSVKKINIR